MQQLEQRSSSTVWLPDDSPRVADALTYKDKSTQFQISRLKRNFRWAQSDPETFQDRLEALKGQVDQCLIRYDNDRPYTYSGLAEMLCTRFGWSHQRTTPTLSGKLIPWAAEPPPMRYYQQAAVEALEAAGHGSISLSTGAGKSLILLNLFKRNPVKTLIITPFRSITNQIHADMIKYFGKKYVGIYGDGKKDFKKLVTVATAQSLARLEPGSDAYEEISKCEVMMFDESHMCVPDMMEKVCMGIAGNAGRRYFVSATQIRNDGSELLLKGIIGPIVYAKEFNDLVEEGFLKKPMFKFFKVNPYGDYSSQDAKAETRAQLYNNPNVHALVSVVVNHALKQNRQVVILIEEFRQFSLLLNHLQVPFEFAHGGASEDAKELIPKDYWESDTEGAVARFNAGETKVLIGTSAISTGVDLRPVGCLIYMQGGLSEIKIKQAIGRGTRVTPGLKDFWVVDFIVRGSSVLERHAGVRADMYSELGTVEFFG